MPQPRRALVPLAVAAMLVLSAAGEAIALSTRYPHQSLGNRGADVRTIQRLLREQGATIRVGGVFDAATRDAVAAFQAARGLTVSGEVDSATWIRLRIPLAPGASGEAVKALQRQLNEKRGARLRLTGVYDTATRDAVASFQRHTRLTPTGAADGLTWRTLISHLDRPLWADRLCDYSVGNGPANWGTGAAIGQLEAAAEIVVSKGHGRVALGDIGLEHGGDIRGHATHEYGLDVDVRPMRIRRNQCSWGVSWRSAAYDRAATRDLVRAIRATAPGHVKRIWFNDPVLIREGLVRWNRGHDDHLHIRYCETVHPVAAYDC